MNVSLKKPKSLFTTEEFNVIKQFIHFLQSEIPLSKKIKITFVDKRDGEMTTGVRKNGGNIYVLSGKRLLIDVLRTISHEWVHEYQFQKMDLDKVKKIPDIGGPAENMANVLSGIFLKKFQKKHSNLNKTIYAESKKSRI